MYSIQGKSVTIVDDTAFYQNMNLSLVLGRFCNAKCGFCVAEIPTGYSSHESVLHRDYFDKLTAAFEKVRHLTTSISITGGEPTMSGKFPESLQFAKTAGVEKFGITTNGSRFSDAEIISAIIDANPSYVNISRHHYDHELNQDIMQISLPDYQVALRQLPNPRFNCVLLKGFVDSPAQCLRFLEYSLRHGVRTVSFRKPTGRSYSDFVRRHDVHFSPIVAWFLEHGELKKTIYGPFYTVRVVEFEGMTILLDETEMVPPPEVVKADCQALGVCRVVYELVFTQGGKLCTSWDGREEV